MVLPRLVLILIAPFVLVTLLLSPGLAGLPGFEEPPAAVPTGGPGTGQPCLLGAPPGDTLYEEDFEAGAPGWSTRSTPGRPNLWHWTTFAGNGSAHDALFHGGPGRLYYGIENEDGGTYNTHNRNQGEIRSPAIDVPADGRYAIAINTKWHVEFDRPLIIDSMVLGYATGGGERVPFCCMGNAWAPYWNIPMGYGYYHVSPWGNAIFTGCEYALESPQNPCRLAQDWAGQDVTFDLAPQIALWEARYALLPEHVAGESLQVSLWFQTGDAIVDDAMGFMVDDVRLLRIA